MQMIGGRDPVLQGIWQLAVEVTQLAMSGDTDYCNKPSYACWKAA
jgi:hypothetical protein